MKKSTAKKKPTSQKVLMPPSEPKQLSAIEKAQHMIALCHELIATAGFPANRHDQVKASLEYLMLLHKQCDEGREAVEPEVVSSPKEASLEHP